MVGRIIFEGQRQFYLSFNVISELLLTTYSSTLVVIRALEIRQRAT